MYMVTSTKNYNSASRARAEEDPINGRIIR
jgi:hypothetical protein